jgi:hypothetical protein
VLLHFETTIMKKLKKQNHTKVALFAGAAALMALTPNTHAQSSVDALLNKLEQKGILTVDEAKELKTENQQDSAADLNKAFNSKIAMPDWVTSYKLYGDFRGRYDQMSTDSGGNTATALSGQDRVRLRYRLRVGLTINMKDDLQVGFRLGSGDANGGSASFASSGSPLSNNTTMQDNATKKMIYIDAAYGKWTPINDGVWMLGGTIGKMDQPFQVSQMVFDSDYTPEGAALQGSYKINDNHSLAVNSAAFVLDEVKSSGRDPFIIGAQAIWNANWTPRIASSLGFGAFDIINRAGLGLANATPPISDYNAGGVPNVNQGNTRNSNGELIYSYNPIIASASATYTLDSFPLYKGKFPIKISGEYMNNPGADPATGSAHNQGIWGGIQLGKSGKKGTWDIFYRYQYLEADAWYDELVDDDNVAFYSNKNSASLQLNGWASGTNMKGHLIKFNYSLTDALTFTFTTYINDLINPNLNTGGLGEPQNHSLHVMADLMWKF